MSHTILYKYDYSSYFAWLIEFFSVDHISILESISLFINIKVILKIKLILNSRQVYYHTIIIIYLIFNYKHVG